MQTSFSQWVNQLGQSAPPLQVTLIAQDRPFVEEMLPQLVATLIGGAIALLGVYLTNAHQERVARDQEERAWRARQSEKEEAGIKDALDRIDRARTNAQALKVSAVMDRDAKQYAMLREELEVNLRVVRAFCKELLPHRGAAYFALADAYQAFERCIVRRVSATQAVPEISEITERHDEFTEAAIELSRQIREDARCFSRILHARLPEQPESVRVEFARLEVEYLDWANSAFPRGARVTAIDKNDSTESK